MTRESMCAYGIIILMDVITNLLLGLITVLVAAVGYFVKKIMDDTTALKTQLKPMVPAIVEIQGKFAEAGYKVLFPLTVAPGSPLHVTEYGDTLLRESGFYDVLQANREHLVRLVKDSNPKTNYDIQQNSIEIIKGLFESDDEMALPLKEYAFNTGTTLEVLVQPAGITLRDEVMKELKF